MVNVCEILGTRYPIIQGAMARIAECNLAAAVDVYKRQVRGYERWM